MTAPTFLPGDIVVMDSRQALAIEHTGAELRFLPPYSSDFNPIEMAFSRFKAFLKEAAARTINDPYNVIAKSIEIFLPTEYENQYILHAKGGQIEVIFVD